MKDALVEMKQTKEYLVCIDSDGCLLDNMELKHKECFCPATVNCWNLQGASKYVREVAEFVNLYSRMRGFNRFPAIIRTLELSYARPQVRERGLVCPDLEPLKAWIRTTPVLSAAALEEYAGSHQDLSPVLLQAARWSREVDANIEHIVRNVQVFPFVRETLEKLSKFADIIVVSATPHEALLRELTSTGIADMFNVIAGQELGTKSECIRKAKEGRYRAGHVLKIGDAPADLTAAKDNDVLFNPIIAGRERDSWRNVLEVSADKFREEQFQGAYMDGLIKDFLDCLSEEPHWNIL